MNEEILTYYNRIVDEVSDLIQLSLSIESRINGIYNKTENSENYFYSEILALRKLISELDLFVQKLIDKLSVLGKSTSSYVSREEFDLIKKNVNQINFENLLLRNKKLFK